MSTHTFAPLFDQLSDPVVVADLKGVIRYINPVASTLLGGVPSQFIDQPLTSIIPARLRADHAAGFARYTGGAEPRLVGKGPVNLPALRRDGSEVPIELTLSVLDNDFIVGILRDRREQRDLERELAVTAFLRASVQAATEFAQIDDPLRLTRAVVKRLSRDFDALAARVWIIEGKQMRVAAWAGPTDDKTFSVEPVNMARYPYRVAAVARSRKPFISNNPASDKLLDREWLAAHNVRSLAALPLLHGKRLFGVLIYYGKVEILPEMAEALRAFTLMVAGGMHDTERVESLHQTLSQLEKSRSRSAFLAEAGAVLGSSLDYETTMAQLAQLAVPELGDWCAIYVINAEGVPQQLAVAHKDSKTLALVQEMQQQWPPPLLTNGPAVSLVLTTGKVQFIPQISPEQLERLSLDQPQRRAVLEKLGFHSLLTVPLLSRGRILGAITLIKSQTPGAYTKEDLAFTQELAVRAAHAVDNARLYTEAENAIRSRNEFLSLASHELRTPITVMMGNAQLLANLVQRILEANPGAENIEVNAARVLKRTASVEEAARNLAKIGEQLLDVTRLQRGVLEIRPDLTDLVAIIKRVVEGARLMQQQGRYHADSVLAVELPDQPVFGTWDEERLEQVLNNLIDNALKYSGAAGHVMVGLTSQDPDGPVHVTVTDDGMGVPLTQQRAIFEPYARASNASADSFPGFGMGLALCRTLIELHGGKIELDSAGEGEGSVFSVNLPRHATATAIA